MKDICNLTGLCLSALLAISCTPSGAQDADTPPAAVEFEPDMTSLVRNPMTGWALYDDANDYVADAAEYWDDQNVIAEKFGSIFYWRSRWSELEPEEGKYAWDCDENFKALIQGALDRGLKLAFRVYIDGQDNIYNGTPDFVRTAGAEGYPSHRLWDAEGVDNNWTPYADDPVFQEKFSNFIRAFAEEFDDPSRVDFIDAYNLGWWGEGHHVRYKDPANKNAVYKWITDLYSDNFRNVILVTNFGTEMGYDIEKMYAIDQKGFIIRRDSMGSTWFLDADVKTVLSTFPQTAFIAESCYWGGYSDSYQPWNTDPVYKDVYKGWRDFYEQAYEDAIRSRANVLDLREATESRGWTRKALDLVEAFMVNGGYRLTPVRLSFPEEFASGETVTISHTWRNSGVGVCPNNNIRWNYKYKVAFALIDKESGAVADIMRDDRAEPSAWLKGNDVTYDFSTSTDVPAGNYLLCTGIVDTSSDETVPALNLAVENGTFRDGWLVLKEIKIK